MDAGVRRAFVRLVFFLRANSSFDDALAKRTSHHLKTALDIQDGAAMFVIAYIESVIVHFRCAWNTDYCNARDVIFARLNIHMPVPRA